MDETESDSVGAWVFVPAADPSLRNLTDVSLGGSTMSDGVGSWPFAATDGKR